MLKRSLLIMIICLLFPAVSPVQALELPVGEIIETPTTTYQKTFSIDTTLPIWEKAMDNPSLMGQLWVIYGFRPPYRVTRTNAGIHVSDPQGIIGDVRQIDRSDRSRTFCATGSFNHWAIPSFFTASGVVIFAYEAGSKGITGVVELFMRGDNGISRFVMALFSGILARHIDNRIGSTLENMEEIILDITHNPQSVRDRLTGRMLRDFDRVFPAKGNGPAKNQERP